MEHQHLNNKEAIEKLKNIVEEIKVAMMATIHDGELYSRPMHSMEVDAEGNIWFFTSKDSEKVEDVEEDSTIYLMYAHPGRHTYLHVKGTSTIVEDQQKIDELWSSFVQAWFPKGKDDPNLCLMKVKTQEASYWDSATSKFVLFFQIAKALLKGERHQDGDVGHLHINS
ncbi:pyridoxamine 5'-phosphate oxidase family protein [Aridibaculum aurantiacum]|uniref:pyridoxamine 5'-phosphate oxidase family protein n=1 Tax=Aridibaculum aurantiacum TaxID=2810307 RepID=UPI001A964A4D|nr:pyridoxamine 5'-phosphate oxidase family protein [Aridibaculum aurantiacum]